MVATVYSVIVRRGDKVVSTQKTIRQKVARAIYDTLVEYGRKVFAYECTSFHNNLGDWNEATCFDDNGVPVEYEINNAEMLVGAVDEHESVIRWYLAGGQVVKSPCKDIDRLTNGEVIEKAC